MINDFKGWVETVLIGYACTMHWVEFESTATTRYCVIQARGGPAPDVDDRYPRFRVVLLGRRNERGDAVGLLADAESLIVAGMGDSLPCGAANVRAIGEVSGPGITEENRAWCQVDFEVLF